MADMISLNPLKRVSHFSLTTESKSTDAVRENLSYSPECEEKISVQTYTKFAPEEPALGTVFEEKMVDFQQAKESVTQQQILDTDKQAEVSRTNQHIDQHLKPLSSSEEYSRDSEDVLMLENDEIAERAETCSRELEDMCKMLKKMHEEAKDLLVRAIVNNNLLLMLNHPLHEEKIQTIQKYVAGMLPE